MRPEDCRYFRSCSAPLCPLDPEIHKRSWIAGEPICRRRDIEAPPWLEMQRRYQKIGVQGYFRVGPDGRLKRVGFKGHVSRGQ